jgi:8-oxo-dGTP diphosphatase
MTASAALHVAVGVVRDQDGNILLTQRAKHAHQGGLWEFPGGKLEANETVMQALQRELHEEVGITVQVAKPLIKIKHCYPDLQVLLDVWQVNHFQGRATACEGQAMRWVAPKHLSQFQFPVANVPIIAASRLPDRYAILEGSNAEEVLGNLQSMLNHQVSLLQLRLKSLPTTEIEAVQRAVLPICRQHKVTVLINSDLPFSEHLADGLHLSSRALMGCENRPEHFEWVAASCHNLQELKQAELIGLDFVVLAPVLLTSTHPNTTPLGWENLQSLIDQVNLPVFALGGLSLQDIDRVIDAGGQGIAGISAFL